MEVNVTANRIVFMSSLNVLLLFGPNNVVTVVDTNLGCVLQTVQLPGECFLCVCVCVGSRNLGGMGEVVVDYMTYLPGAIPI